MKKQKNATRIIAIVLVALMALALIPIAASAEGETVTWTFDGGVGSFTDADGEHTVYEQDLLLGVDTVLKIPDFSYEGYTLKGWKRTNHDDGERLWSNGDHVSSGMDSRLEAVWEEITEDEPVSTTPSVDRGGSQLRGDPPATVTVTYAAGEHGTGSSYEDPDKTAGSSYTLLQLADTGINAATGYAFKAWSYDDEEKAPGTSITLPNTNVTITALWDMVNPVTYTFDGNNATAGNPPDDITRPLALLPVSPVPAPGAETLRRTGYKFDGWTEIADGSPVIAEGSNLPAPSAAGTKTMYAHWSDDMVAVEYTDGTNTYSAGNIRRGYGFQTKLFSQCTGLSAPANKVFAKWHDWANDYGENASYTIPADSAMTTIIFTAQFVDACTVNFVTSGGSAVSPGPNPRTNVPKGSSITLPNSTKDGHVLEGWYPNDEYTASERVGGYGDAYTVNDNQVYLYAHFVSTTIPVTYGSGTGGTGTKTTPATAPRTMDAEHPATFTLPASEGFSPVDEDNTFIGWKVGVNGDPAEDAAVRPAGYSFEVPLAAESLKLVAQWASTAVPVLYHPNGGEGTATTTPHQMSRTVARTLRSLGELEFTAPADKCFLGWGRTSTGPAVFTDGQSVKWDSSSEAKTPEESGNTVLYAIWGDALKGTVTYKNSQGTAITEAKVGETVTAVPDVTAPTDPKPGADDLLYRWLRSGTTVVGTGKTYTIQPNDVGKSLTVEIVPKDDTYFSGNKGKIEGGDLGTTSDQMTTLTFNVTGVSTDSIDVNGTPVTISPSGTGTGTAEVVRNADITVTLTPADGRIVKTVKVGSTEKTPAYVYIWKFSSESETITVVFDAPAHGNEKTADIKEGVDVSDTEQKAAAAAQATLPIGQKGRVWAGAAAVIPCWDHNVTNPLVIPDEIPNTGLSFKLPYPKGSDFNTTVAANMPKYYNITVYHKKADGTLETVPTERVTPGTAFTAGVTVTGQTAFSDFAVTVTPKELDGALNLDASAAYVGTQIKATYSKTTQGTPKYQWQTKGTSDTNWTNVGTGQTYTPTKDDKGKSLRCVFTTTDFETGSVISKTVTVGARPNPVQKKGGYVVNWNNSAYPFAQAGVIANLTDEMQYTRYPYAKKTDVDDTAWVNVGNGKTESGGLSEGGTYWVRFKDDPEEYWASVTIDEYFTVTAAPDSVSTNRLYFTASGSYSELIAGRVWLVPKGKSINVTANSANTNYYKITQLRTKNLYTDNVTVRTINKANSGSTGSFTVSAPYYVSATAGVYGSKTGDTSHLELWVELAALSLMGLGAALVLGRKKLKAQK